MIYKAKKIKIEKALVMYRVLHKSDPNIAICGSLALFLYKLNKRETVNDLDFIVRYDSGISELELFTYMPREGNFKHKKGINKGSPENQVPGIIYHKEDYWRGSDIKLDLFFVKPFKTIIIRYKGYNYRVQCISHILLINLAWADDNKGVVKKYKYRNNVSKFIPKNTLQKSIDANRAFDNDDLPF